MNKRLRSELAFMLGTGALLSSASRLLNPRSRSIGPIGAGLGFAALALWAWPRRKFTYEDKCVVITGASRGLGFAMARELLLAGAKVTLLARDTEELEHAKRELHQISPNVFTAHCDVTQCEQLELAFAEARARFGAIDVLINNAGVISVGPFETMETADFEAQFSVHLRGPIEATRLIRPYFHQQGEGRIINISSIGGKIAMPHMSSYCASKFALAGFSESVREELKKENIFVTTAYPGLMRTGSPIQAVFKGNAEKEFLWFAASDNTPGLSISPERAARQILDAACEGQAEVFVSLPAKVSSTFHDLFPETTSALMGLAARLMPESSSKERRTGAAAAGLFKNSRGLGLMRAIFRRAAMTHNQAPTYDANASLGIRPEEPVPQY